MRTQYELKKKERSSLLANMSLEQHAFSYNQKHQFKIPELPTASGNIREKMESNKETSSPSTPSKSMRMTTVTPDTPCAGSSRLVSKQAINEEAPVAAGTANNDTEEDTESCFETTIQESQLRKRKWFSFF